MVKFNNEWDEILEDEFSKPYYLKLRQFLKEEYSNYTIYPAMNDIFNSLKYASYSDIKVVIIGQDPYHEPGQAHGLSFSVKEGTPCPPSLKNIFKEINSDLGIPIADSGNLTCWAKQGVLLMNAVLTVRQGMANSHKGKGWEQFTDNVISILNKKEQPIVFLLWGANARSKKELITNPIHLVLECAHPSPLSAFNGFFGCKHFSKCNDFLTANNMSPINWNLNNK